MRVLTLMTVVAVAAACGDDDDNNNPGPGTRAITLTFAGEINGMAAQCGTTYDNVGTSTQGYTLGDFRFYIHNVRLLEASSGNEVPLEMDDGPVWQDGTVALLDFEDGSGPCMNGTTETNSVVMGTVPDGDYDGLRFVLGVPFEQNHQDAAVAPAPLNVTALFWNWNAGYKYARIDGASGNNPFRFHLGSTGCQMDNNGVVTSCANPNRMQVELTSFDPDTQTIVADHGRVLATTDTSTSVNATQPGCQSNPNDGDCVEIFDRLGLPFGQNQGDGNQVMFEAR